MTVVGNSFAKKSGPVSGYKQSLKKTKMSWALVVVVYYEAKLMSVGTVEIL